MLSKATILATDGTMEAAIRMEAMTLAEPNGSKSQAVSCKLLVRVWK